MIEGTVPRKIEVAEETKKRLAFAYLGLPIEGLSPLDILKIVETYSKAKKSLKNQKKPKLRKNGNHNFHQRRCIPRTSFPIKKGKFIKEGKHAFGNWKKNKI